MDTKITKNDDFDFGDSLMLPVPTDVANLRLPDPDLREHYIDEANRVCWLDDSVNILAINIARKIRKWNIEDAGLPTNMRKRILIMIDSPGGAVDSEAALLGAMKISKTPVYTCVYCDAFSAAADILACGHMRYAMPFTSIMFHAGSCQFAGTQSQVESTKKYYDYFGKKINREVFSHTKFDDKIKQKIKTDDFFFDEKRAVEYGVVDKIITDFSEIM